MHLTVIFHPHTEAVHRFAHSRAFYQRQQAQTTPYPDTATPILLTHPLSAVLIPAPELLGPPDMARTASHAYFMRDIQQEYPQSTRHDITLRSSQGNTSTPLILIPHTVTLTPTELTALPTPLLSLPAPTGILMLLPSQVPAALPSQVLWGEFPHAP